MTNIYETDSYKDFLKSWISKRPNGGRGESRKIAEKLSLSTTMVSQVLSGDKDFTMESASDLCDYIALNERETDHFLLLVDYARAGSHNLKQRLHRRILASRDRAQKLSEKVERPRDISDAEAAIYYSSWIYTGTVNVLATQPQADAIGLAQRLNLPVPLMVKVLSFLIESGIVVQVPENGIDLLKIGVKSTWIPADSPVVIKHHHNWRQQAFNRMPLMNKEDLFFSAPMSLSLEVAQKIREDLPLYIKKLSEWIGPSESEVVRCLNVDYFEY